MTRKFSLSILAIVFSIHAWSYNGQLSPKVDKENEHGYTAFSGAYFMLPVSNLNSQLSKYGFKTGFANAIGLGIDRYGEARSDEFKFPFVTYLGYHYFLPQEISTSGDSLKMKLNGYSFQFDFIGGNYLNSETMCLTGGIGWTFGRLKDTENSAAGTSTFLEKYFGPELRLEQNILLGNHFYIGVRGAYKRDLTKTGWSRTGVISNPDLPGMRVDGAMAGAFIGYGK